MNFNDLDEIKKASFIGFKTVKELFDDHSCIDNVKGIYLVLYLHNNPPEFLTIGSGPNLYKKKKNPNVPVEELKLKWVENTIVINIGKAGGKNNKGIETKATLRSRLIPYLKFGNGRDVTHYGGRYIWQLGNSNDLVICWKKLPEGEPRAEEKKLIAAFKLQYKVRPFANLSD
jgi:hypothetical protein